MGNYPTEMMKINARNARIPVYEENLNFRHSAMFVNAGPAPTFTNIYRVVSLNFVRILAFLALNLVISI